LSIFREIPPTAGWPLTFTSLILPLFKKHPQGLLEDDFKKYLGASSALLTYSGTAAFYIILETIKKISNKKTVIIPAFICPLIPLAIKRAGLNIKVCDTNSDNFDFNPEKLRAACKENKDILAILAVHLGGIPVDFDKLKEISKDANALIIEDCAQSLGAEYRGKKTGSLGDFSFFSLCRGKGLTPYEGGIAISNCEQYSKLLSQTANKIMPEGHLSEALKIIELFAYSIFYQPLLFWFAYRAPQLFYKLSNNPVKAAGEYFNVNFPMHKISSYRESIGHLGFSELNKMIAQQRETVDKYLLRLKSSSGIQPILETQNTKASYPYLSIIFSDQQKRNLTLKTLGGLGVSQIYLHAITDYQYLKNIVPDTDCPNSRKLSENSLTLSTSCFLKEKDTNNITNTIKGI